MLNRFLILIVSLLLAESSVLSPGYSSTVPFVNIPLAENSGEVGDFVSTIYGFAITSLGNLYVVTDPDNPSFLKVIERLPSGGFGRILRYRGWMQEGKWLDLEFVYQDKENSVTILDYVSGKFFRTVFTEKRKHRSSVFPLSNQKGFTGDLTASQPSSSKFILMRQESQGRGLTEIHWLHTQIEGLSREELWSRRHTRGPPEGGMTS